MIFSSARHIAALRLVLAGLLCVVALQTLETSHLHSADDPGYALCQLCADPLEHNAAKIAVDPYVELAFSAALPAVTRRAYSVVNVFAPIRGPPINA